MLMVYAQLVQISNAIALNLFFIWPEEKLQSKTCKRLWSLLLLHAEIAADRPIAPTTMMMSPGTSSLTHLSENTFRNRSSKYTFCKRCGGVGAISWDSAHMDGTRELVICQVLAVVAPILAIINKIWWGAFWKLRLALRHIAQISQWQIGKQTNPQQSLCHSCLCMKWLQHCLQHKHGWKMLSIFPSTLASRRPKRTWRLLSEFHLLHVWCSWVCSAMVCPSKSQEHGNCQLECCVNSKLAMFHVHMHRETRSLLLRLLRKMYAECNCWDLQMVHPSVDHWDMAELQTWWLRIAFGWQTPTKTVKDRSVSMAICRKCEAIGCTPYVPDQTFIFIWSGSGIL